MDHSNLLKQVENYCVGRAEAEESFLIDAFVSADFVHEILESPLNSPTLLIGRKGTGKTAVLKYLKVMAERSNIKCIYLKPDDFPLVEEIDNANTTASLKRIAFRDLVSIIASKLGADLRGLLGKKDKKLFDKAIQNGDNSPDFLQACLRGFLKIGSIVKGIDFTQLIPNEKLENSESLLDSIKSNITRSGSIFLLLLDDLDQVAMINDPGQINRIWGFILAAQKLSETLPHFKTIISLRTEIWALLERDEHSQRDQVDHVRRLIKSLDPSDDEIKKIIEKRLNLVRNVIGPPISTYSNSIFFKEDVVSLPSSEEKRLWIDYLATSSRRRPRDALQLLNLLAKKSREAGFSKIDGKVVDETAIIYSTERIEDLTREFTKDCKVVREIIETFSELEFLISSDDLKNHLNKLPTKFGLIIRNKTIHADNSHDIFFLWNFIHELSFLNPRIPDERNSREFRHILYDDYHSFVTEANWNEMQKVQWEIHPAYRFFLLQKKKNNKARKFRFF